VPDDNYIALLEMAKHPHKFRLFIIVVNADVSIQPFAPEGLKGIMLELGTLAY
jgi:hypothetical protein